MTTPDLIARLRQQADEIDKAVSRNSQDREDGVFCEIEYMREAADALEAALAVTEPFAEIVEMAERSISTGFNPRKNKFTLVEADAVRAIRDWRAGIIGGEKP